jgi:hypothetical protein
MGKVYLFMLIPIDYKVEFLNLELKIIPVYEDSVIYPINSLSF